MNNNMQNPYDIQCNEVKRDRMLNRTSFDPDTCKFECSLCGLKVKYNNMRNHEKCKRHKNALIEWKKVHSNLIIECDVVLEII